MARVILTRFWLEDNQEDSMSKSQPIYSKEFKQEALQLLETSGKSKTQMARDLGISDSALSKWCKEFGTLGEDAFPGKGHQIPIENARRKRRKVRTTNSNHNAPVASNLLERDFTADAPQSKMGGRYDLHCHL